MVSSSPILCSLVLVALSSHVLAQCPVGTMKVRGQIDNLPADAATAKVLVTLEMPNEEKFQTASVSNGGFSSEIRFGTQSASYFPLWGHRCNSVPKSVAIKVMVGNRIAGRITLTFKDDFETESPNIYRQRRELTIKASCLD
jgi:hypothetical protein